MYKQNYINISIEDSGDVRLEYAREGAFITTLDIASVLVDISDIRAISNVLAEIADLHDEDCGND